MDENIRKKILPYCRDDGGC